MIEENLIQDKIAIPAKNPRISRPRLIRLLTENLFSANATIINGRAGTGKTLLAADFARRARRAVAWYKVDATDDDLLLFFAYLVTTIRLQRPTINAGHLLKLSETVRSDRAELLADAVVFQLDETKGEPLLIVIEDLHLVYDADWVVPFFRRWLPLLPPDVHVLITCRSLPPNPLWRLRSKQMLRVVEENELAFTPDEAIALFESCGLSDEQARLAWARTNGKVSALLDSATLPGRAGATAGDRTLLPPRVQFSLAPDMQS